MTVTQSNIGIPVEQGFYTLIVGILPKNDKPLYLYDPSDERVNGCELYGVSIHESIIDIIPTCKIELEVPYTWLDAQYLTDGTLVSIDLKINEKIVSTRSDLNEDPYIFRLFYIDKIEDHGVFVRVILSCVIDFLPGYGDANGLNCSCTTSNVFKKCAKEYGFTDTDIDDTKDAQLWIGNGRTIYQFLSYCCQCGSVNDTSGMMWAIDRNKKLYYKNVPECFKSGCKDKGCQNIRVGSLGVPVVGTVPFGLNNVKYGTYGSDGDVFTLVDGEDSKYDYVKVDVNNLVKTTESTCVCKGCKCKNGQNWFPFDVGNHYDRYFHAIIQNRQILSTYTTFLSVRFTPSTGIVAKNSIVPFFEAFHLFDTCNVEYDVNFTGNDYVVMNALSSKYMVKSIDVNITQGHAATCVELVTQGFNTKSKNETVN